MVESLFADGALAGLENRVVAFVFKCLAVGGGFLAGYFLGGVLAWALDRWAFGRQAPEQLKKAVAIVAGILLAVVVALIVFGDGGSGLFGGGGSGDGKGTPNPSDTGKPDPQVPPKKDEVPPKKVEPVTPPKPADATIRVTVLGGSDVPPDDLKFYLLDDDPARKSFDELKDAILARKRAEKGTVAISIHVRPKNAPSLDPRHYSIAQLEGWARDTAKMDVTIAAQK